MTRKGSLYVVKSLCTDFQHNLLNSSIPRKNPLKRVIAAFWRLHWKKKLKKGLLHVLRSLCTDFKHSRHLLLSPITKSLKSALLRHYGSSCGAEKSKRITKRLLYVSRSLCATFQHNCHSFSSLIKNPLKRRFYGVGSGACKSKRDK